MRHHLIFVFATIVAISAVVFISVALREQKLFYFNSEHESADGFLANLRETHKPLMEINLTDLYGSSGQFRMLHPLLDVKRLQLNAFNVACPMGQTQGGSIDIKSPRSCQIPNLSGADPEALAKKKWFERIRRREVEVTDNFVASPPLIDESGASYAYLLALNSIPPFDNRSWIRGHLSFFKISELKEIIDRYRIESSVFSTIANLDDAEIKELVEGSSVVMTRRFLLVKDQSRLGFSPLSYWVYDLDDVRANLSDKKFDLVGFTSDTFCLQRIGNVCWTYNSKTALSYAYRYAVAILLIVAVSFIVFLALYIRHLHSKNREQQKHRLALQVLSHEFRTPLSSMLLSLEELTKDHSRFESHDQDLLTKVSAEAFRLQRVIEMSKTYLQSAGAANRFNFVQIASLNSWISEYAADLDPRVQCELLKRDRGIEADIFWLRFALTNLVQNAFAHGKEPVTIRLSDTAGKVRITVEDQGHCEFASLDKMSEAFVKSSRSKGMGLGLNITNVVVSDWGSRLEFSTHPTSFTLALEQTDKGSKRWRAF